MVGTSTGAKTARRIAARHEARDLRVAADVGEPLRRMRRIEGDVGSIYLLRGVAHANPADERLFAIGEVRDLTAVRDEQGHVVALPELERMLVEQLEAVRAFQAAARRGAGCSGIDCCCTCGRSST